MSQAVEWGAESLPQWRIREAHENVESSAKDVLYWAQIAGKELQAQKERLGRGEWLPWVEQNLPFSVRTAEVYMRLYNGRALIKANSQNSAAVSINAALSLLKKPKPQIEAPPAPKPPSERETIGFLREQTPPAEAGEEEPVSGEILPAAPTVREWTDSQHGKYQRVVQQAEALRAAIGAASETQGFGAKDHITSAAIACRKLTSQLDDLAASF